MEKEEKVVKTPYIVKKGDSLNQIAAELKTTYKALADLNGIKEPWILTVGQKLKAE